MGRSSAAAALFEEPIVSSSNFVDDATTGKTLRARSRAGNLTAKEGMVHASV
jgi:hypothetical protein